MNFLKSWQWSNRPDNATATLSTPPMPSKRFLPLGPKTLTRKSSPWAWSRAFRNAAVSSTGGLVAKNLNLF